VEQSPSQPLGSYARTTHQITVTVRPFYLEEQSVPAAGHFVWAYHVRIENNGDETVRLLARHWRITDSLGTLQEVRGEGVVGKQPVLRPGEVFEYASGTPLPTPSGIMVGTYHMWSEKGGDFDVDIPAFSLDSPHITGPVH
jgi:ApaG protein